MNFFDGLFFVGILLVILLYVGTTIYSIKSAVEEYVKPKLEKQGFVFVKHEWIGWGTGDLNEGIFSLIGVRGSPYMSIYAYIYYEDAGVEKRFTIRIKTFLFFK